VCNNCLSLIRRERDQRESTDGGKSTAKLSAYTRVKHQTEVGHGPGAEPTQCTAVWCDCGVESAFERIWDDGDDRCLTTQRVKEYLRNCIRSLEHKGVSLDRKTTIALALQYYRDTHDFNGALEQAIKTGIRKAAASNMSKSKA
jgi:hypothetical protein